jgi:hypothetical protein
MIGSNEANRMEQSNASSQSPQTIACDHLGRLCSPSSTLIFPRQKYWHVSSLYNLHRYTPKQETP